MRGVMEYRCKEILNLKVVLKGITLLFIADYNAST